MNAFAVLLANDKNIDAAFRAVFATAPKPVTPVDDDEVEPGSLVGKAPATETGD